MKKFKTFSVAVALSALLVGCGDSSSSSSTPNTSSTLTQGTLIDDYVSGVRYVNGSNSGYTDSNGEFPYSGGEVSFYVGHILLGTLSSLPTDEKVFVQDLVGVSRTDTSDSEVMRLASFLQSLDSDPATDIIEIDQSDFDQFNDVNDSIQDITMFTDMMQTRGFSVVKESQVQAHLGNVLKFHGEVVDSDAPTLVSSSITNNVLNVALDVEIELEFSENIPKNFLTSEYFTLKNSENTEVDTNITRDGNSVDIAPSQNLVNDETYTLTVKGSIEDYAGNAIGEDSIINFSTLASGNTNQAPQINIAGGLTQTVVQGQSITIDASGTTDDSSGAITYEFMVLENGTTQVDGTANSSATNTFTVDTTSLSVGTHTVIVYAYDSSNTQSQAIVSLSVTAANVAPTADAGSDRTITEGGSFTLSAFDSSDSDGSIASYEWSYDGSVIGSTMNHNVQNLTVGTHTFTLTVTDNDGASDTDTVVVTVSAAAAAANNAPTANAGADQTVNEGDSVTLNASASSDSDGNIASYRWTKGGVVYSNNSSFVVSSLTVGTHTFTLTVTDDDGATSTDMVDITVNAAVATNNAPTANAGADQTVNEGDRVYFMGNNSSDSDGSITAYSWTKDGTLYSNNSLFFIDTLSVGTHTFTLTVTDDDGATDTDTVVVTVNAVAVSLNAVANALNGDSTPQCAPYNGHWSGLAAWFEATASQSTGSNITYEWYDESGGLQGSQMTQTVWCSGLTTGFHSWTLTVTDDNGVTDSTTISFEVIQ